MREREKLKKQQKKAFKKPEHKTHCPFCRRKLPEIDQSLRFDWQRGFISRGGMVVELTPRQADTFKVVFDAYPDYIPSVIFADRILGQEDNIDGTDRERNTSVFLAQVRVKIKPLKLKIESRIGYGKRLILLPLQAPKNRKKDNDTGK